MKKVLRKSSLVAGILILIVVCLGVVFAGDVIVKEGVIEGVIFKSTDCTATGTKAVAFGYSTEASGNYSTAMGYDTTTTASATCATAMGGSTTASGTFSTAMGLQTTASGQYSTAMGFNTTASGNKSTAMGNGTIASGEYSIAMGYFTTASTTNSTAFGKWSDNEVANSFTVGYGGPPSHKVDFRVRSGKVNVYGDLEVDDKVTMGTLVLPTGASNPGSPVEGQIYLNTTDDEVRVYVDGEWKDLAWAQ